MKWQDLYKIFRRLSSFQEGLYSRKESIDHYMLKLFIDFIRWDDIKPDAYERGWRSLKFDIEMISKQAKDLSGILCWLKQQVEIQYGIQNQKHDEKVSRFMIEYDYNSSQGDGPLMVIHHPLMGESTGAFVCQFKSFWQYGVMSIKIDDQFHLPIVPACVCDDCMPDRSINNIAEQIQRYGFTRLAVTRSDWDWPQAKEWCNIQLIPVREQNWIETYE